ncbi:MAG: hypothetical protein J1E62_04980 [Lachnospiraceae bacterium]|nr:hypothetical protein [Lachnospiraceae bacterium]
MNVDVLYRIFYILFAMEVAAVVLFPLLLLLRVLIQNLPKKYMVWMWRLYFLRIICPVAISSPFSIVARWNRWYHRVMEGLGLTIEEESGLLRSWSTVLHGEITTTLSYRVCAWGWLFGVAFLLMVMAFRQGQIKSEIRVREKQLDGRLYQSAVKVPVTTGILRHRFYLPEKTEAKQARYTVAHMEIHSKRNSAIWNLAEFMVTALHWFNPLVWAALSMAKKDEEMACDEETMRRLGLKEKGAYTQSILNMAKEETPMPYTICTIFETGLEKRAQRALHWHRPFIRQRLMGVLLVSFLCVYTFMYRPLQIAWAGSTWQRGESQSIQRTVRETETVAQVSVVSPGGLQHKIKLNVERGSQTGDEIRGRFSLKMEDSMGNAVDEVSLQDAFQKQGIKLDELSFSQGMALHIGDYNNDTAQELIIGQQIDWDDDQRAVVDSLLSTEEDAASDAEDEQNETEETERSSKNTKSDKKEKEETAKDKETKTGTKEKETGSSSKGKETKTGTKEKETGSSSKGKETKTDTKEKETGSSSKDKEEETDTKEKETESSSKDKEEETDTKEKETESSSKDEETKANWTETDVEDSENATLVKEYVYLVFQLGEASIEEVSDPVYSRQMSGMESLTPGTMDDIKDIFYTSMEQGRIYYVWNPSEQRYMAQKLGEEQLNQHRLASQGTQESGVTETFTLKDNDGKEWMRVDTETDTTGSKAIRKVIMVRGEREMKPVEGYYCDLQWAIQSDASIGDYAILTYNGTKAQTFIVYDVKNREEFYRHEDGNEILNRVFGQYNDSEMHFEPGSAVIYTLLEQKDNLLTISFAAQAKGDIAVGGVYDYDVEKGRISNLQFSQNNGTAQNTTSSQQGSGTGGTNGNDASLQP